MFGALLEVERRKICTTPARANDLEVKIVLLCSDHFAWQLQEFVCLGSTFSWQAQYFWSIHLKIVKTYWNSEVECLVNLSFLKEVSQKCCVFEVQSFNFEGCLAQKLRFWASKLRFWRKSRRKASFLIFKAWISNQLTTKSLEPQINWQPNHLNLTSVGNQIIWISNHVTSKSLESRINWQPNHLNLKSIDNQIIWIPNQLTTKFIWVSNHLTTKSLEISNHPTTKSFDSQFTWIWHRLTFEPIELHTPSSYRFLIFGNFRHRLVR